eukprot:521143-Hanusia_phi.AAC.1
MARAPLLPSSKMNPWKQLASRSARKSAPSTGSKKRRSNKPTRKVTTNPAIKKCVETLVKNATVKFDQTAIGAIEQEVEKHVIDFFKGKVTPAASGNKD